MFIDINVIKQMRNKEGIADEKVEKVYETLLDAVSDVVAGNCLSYLV